MSSTRFTAIEGEMRIPGFLIYRVKEHSIDFIPAVEPVSVASLADQLETVQLSTLQLAVSRTDGRVLYPFGYCPRSMWLDGRVNPVVATPGKVMVDIQPSLPEGVSHELAEEGWDHWVFDEPVSLLERRRLDRQPEGAVEICDGVVLGVASGDLVVIQMSLAFE